jgi:hypothetical protein
MAAAGAGSADAGIWSDAATSRRGAPSAVQVGSGPTLPLPDANPPAPGAGPHSGGRRRPARPALPRGACDDDPPKICAALGATTAPKDGADLLNPRFWSAAALAGWPTAAPGSPFSFWRLRLPYFSSPLSLVQDPVAVSFPGLQAGGGGLPCSFSASRIGTGPAVELSRPAGSNCRPRAGGMREGRGTTAGQTTFFQFQFALSL